MAIWKEQNPAKDKPVLVTQDPAGVRNETFARAASKDEGSARTKEVERMESVIAGDLTIEGKIEGSGHVRLVGKFKGDVHVEGNLTIETGAKVTGSVRAGTVIIGGELEGNVDGASKVELLQTGVLNGDLKAGAVTIAAGSRMRGQAEFGWEEKDRRESRMKLEPTTAP